MSCGKMDLLDDEIPFIADEVAYEEYAKLKPKTKYLYRKVRYTCRGCDVECIKSFRSLSKLFLCPKCQTKMTSIEKYGTDNYSKTRECHDKMKQTCLLRYGVESYSQTDEYKKKIKQTSNQKYGTDSPLQSDEVKRKYKQTCLERYGVENVFQLDSIKDKTKNTMLKKYNVEYYIQSEEGKEKYKTTCLKRYGTDRPARSDEVKLKHKQTCLERYGVESYTQTDEFKEKSRQTCQEKYNSDTYLGSLIGQAAIKTSLLEKYGVENSMQIEEVKNKCRQTCLVKYGYEVSTMSKDIQDKYKNTCLMKYGADNYMKSDEYREKCQYELQERLGLINLRLIDRHEGFINLQCNSCGYEFKYASSTVFNLLNHYDGNFCPNCSRVLTNGKSLKEKKLLEYIRTIYSGEIIENDRNILCGRELDIYLPEVKLAFEFNGTYWHADPRFYCSDDYIIKKGKTAREIWEYDEMKRLDCMLRDIMLVPILEYDWDNKNDEMLGLIRNKIL